jgi:decaprenylphospho-beta-D-erythro-pentofuranosid-2-ulose 2-reductase
MKTMVVLGATSSIAKVFMRYCISQEPYRFIAVGRDKEALEAVQADLTVRGAPQVDIIRADLSDISQISNTTQHILSLAPHIDVLFIAYGILEGETEQVLRVNFTSTALFLEHFRTRFEQQKQGSIAVISSVAGDRGRQSNFVYGSAKGGLNIYLDGLRHALHKHSVYVLTIKPGFIDTPMTAAFKKGPLWAKPETIAPLIYTAIQRKQSVVYVPRFWKWIMAIITRIPEKLFLKTSL